MTDLEQEHFTREAVKAAYRIQLFDEAGGARAALSDTPEQVQRTEELTRAQAEAQRLIRHPSVIERLCPALKSVSGDLGKVAATTASVILPLSIGPQAIFSVTPLVVGAVAVIVVRAGVSALCPEQNKG
jgi:hypothetical protein